MSNFVYINEEDINPDLKCAICSKPFEEPWAHLNCDRIYCYACINRAEFLCPYCKNGKNKYEFFLLKVKAIANLLKELQIECTRCLQKMKRFEFETHQKTNCKSKEVKQEIISCKEEEVIICQHPFQNQLKRKYQEAFNPENNEITLLECPYGCPEKIKKGRFENHLVICLEKPVDCEAVEYGCMEKVRIKDLERHGRECEFMQMIQFFKNVENLNTEYYEKIMSLVTENKNPQKQSYPYGSAFVTRLKKSFPREKKMLQAKMKHYYESNLGIFGTKSKLEGI